MNVASTSRGFFLTFSSGIDDIGFDAADLDRDLIAERLQQDVVRSLAYLTFYRFSEANVCRYSLSMQENFTSVSHQAFVSSLYTLLSKTREIDN